MFNMHFFIAINYEFLFIEYHGLSNDYNYVIFHDLYLLNSERTNLTKVK